MISIEKHIPIPQDYKIRNVKYPFLQMEIGDSFLFDPKYRKALYVQSRYAHQNYGMDFYIAEAEDGMRCWRVNPDLVSQIPVTYDGKYGIDKGIKIPRKRSERFPFNKMEIGDSFLVPDLSVSRLTWFTQEYTRETGIKFKLRKEKKGSRCWRIA